MNVAFHLRGRLQRHGPGADGTRDLAAHGYLLASDQSRDLTLSTDDHFGGLHVALNLSVNLKDTPANDPQSPLPDNLKIIADDRLVATVGGTGSMLLNGGNRRTIGSSRWLARLRRRATRKHELSPRQSPALEVEQRGGLWSISVRWPLQVSGVPWWPLSRRGHARC